jgi:hypothetical protein
MTVLGLDRRILRAFYTQYVAVLLIMLVFFVSAFQKPQGSLDRAPLPIIETPPALSPIAAPFVCNPFMVGEVIEKDNPQLAAISAILRKHDVEATIAFHVASTPVEVKDDELSKISMRVDALERFFQEQQVPLGTTRYLIERGVDGAREGIAVTFQPVRGIHG